MVCTSTALCYTDRMSSSCLHENVSAKLLACYECGADVVPGLGHLMAMARGARTRSNKAAAALETAQDELYSAGLRYTRLLELLEAHYNLEEDNL